ncbi:GNAT family N-acetyltransferase [Mycobacterium sp. PDNC021]|uniref:GNAT family N-acetyltransferase n=1 Tax=Mycobacterium sp. PDNC021 TaxID=3391399 RepID=UPI003AAFE7F6
MKIEQTPGGFTPPVTFSSPARASHETLWDGTKVTVRDLEPEDFPAVLALADNLSGDELYLRFFTYDPKHLAEWAHSVTQPTAGGLSLGAFDGERLVSVGNYITASPVGTAEIAIVVAHRNHHRGIATALLRRLGAQAKAAGIQRLFADALAENRGMRQVIADAGWPYTQHRNDEVLTIEVDLTETGSTGLAEPEPTASPSVLCAVR